MDNRIQIVAIVATALQFVVVFELVRRRRLMSATRCCGCSPPRSCSGLSIRAARSRRSRR